MCVVCNCAYLYTHTRKVFVFSASSMYEFMFKFYTRQRTEKSTLSHEVGKRRQLRRQRTHSLQTTCTKIVICFVWCAHGWVRVAYMYESSHFAWHNRVLESRAYFWSTNPLLIHFMNEFHAVGFRFTSLLCSTTGVACAAPKWPFAIFAVLRFVNSHTQTHAQGII